MNPAESQTRPFPMAFATAGARNAQIVRTNSAFYGLGRPGSSCGLFLSPEASVSACTFWQQGCCTPGFQSPTTHPIAFCCIRLCSGSYRPYWQVGSRGTSTALISENALPSRSPTCMSHLDRNAYRHPYRHQYWNPDRHRIQFSSTTSPACRFSSPSRLIATNTTSRLVFPSKYLLPLVPDRCWWDLHYGRYRDKGASEYWYAIIRDLVPVPHYVQRIHVFCTAGRQTAAAPLFLHTHGPYRYVP